MGVPFGKSVEIWFVQRLIQLSIVAAVGFVAGVVVPLATAATDDRGTSPPVPAGWSRSWPASCAGLGAADVDPRPRRRRVRAATAPCSTAPISGCAPPSASCCPILEADVHSPDELYDAVRTIDWSRVPDAGPHAGRRLQRPRLGASRTRKYAALRVKDAICDQFRERIGRRPSVDVERPMVGLNLHVYRDHAMLSLDSSGDSLHKRGYRPILTKAPLNEALAAGLLLCDRLGRRRAARRSAVRLGHVLHRGGVDRAEPAAGADAQVVRLHGLDGLRPAAVDRDPRRGPAGRAEGNCRTDPRAPTCPATRSSFAETNARAAGIGHLLRFDRPDVTDFRPPDGRPGVSSAIRPTANGSATRRSWSACTASSATCSANTGAAGASFVFTGNDWLARKIGLRIQRSSFFNGKIPCRLWEFETG